MARLKAGGKTFSVMVFAWILAAAINSRAQTETLQFDVASVRQSKSDGKPQSNYPLDNGYIFSTAVRTTRLFLLAGCSRRVTCRC